MRSKTQVRSRCRELRNSLSEKQWSELSSQIALNCIKLLGEYKNAGVFLYRSSVKQREIDTDSIFKHCLDNGYTLAVPITYPGGLMQAVVVDRFTVFSFTDWGIPEPVVVSPDYMNEPDVIIVPLLAADRYGNRIGYGKGYYDRFLAGASGLRVGLCPDCCLVSDIPIEPHDEQLDVLVTESGILRIVADT